MASIEQLTLGIPGAGRRTLLAALPAELRLPQTLRLCVLDALRMDAPEQIALLDELAAQPELRILFVLNKADRVTGLRTAITRSLALLRERGFPRPELIPVCALAGRLLGLAAAGGFPAPEELDAQGDYYYRYGPGENCLPAFAVEEAPACRVGSRELTAAQLRAALENTGLPGLAARLRALALPDEPAPAAPVPEEAPAPEPDAAPEEVPAPELDAAPEEVPAPEAEPAPEEAPAPEAAPVSEEAPAPEAAPAPEEAPAAEAAPAPEEAPAAEAAPVPEEAPAAEEEAVPADPVAAVLFRAKRASCAELLDLARSVQGMDAPDEAREQALDALHKLYLTRELEELDAMTRDAEGLGLPALRNLAERINTGAYTVQTRTPYAEKINRRIDALQSEALEAICAGVEEADGRTLAQIRERLEKADCADVLKSDGFRRIEARQEALDLEALERVTAGAEQLSEKELMALSVTLEAGNWSPKHVGSYRHKVELLREAARFREAAGELGELNDMERRELLSLRDRILEKGLPARFTCAPLAMLDERLYRQDMLRLMALNNDFDRLDFDGIDELRAQVLRGDYCERARQLYLKRLLAREEALIIENTDARAQLVRQLIGQHKMRMADFDIASGSEDYRERLRAYWGGSGMEQPRDIPVFLLDNASDFALTGSRFYYKSGRDLAFEPIENIERLQVMRQHMSLLLQIVRKDNSYLLTGARLGRGGAERTLDFLNECLRRWNEPGMSGVPSASPIRTRRFEAAEFAAPVEPRLPDAADALEIFRKRCADDKLREGNLIREGEDGWEQRSRRLLQNFGLPENTRLIWFNSSTLLGSVREGVALGPAAIYQKEGKLPTQIIPLPEIAGFARSGRQISVSTVRGQSFRLDLPAAMLSPVEDYVKAIQLSAWLRGAEEKK